MKTDDSELSSLPREVLEAVHKVRAKVPSFGPGWTVCFLNRRTGLRASILLSNHEQVSNLALELAARGYALLESSPDPCDFVFEYEEVKPAERCGPDVASSMA